MGLGPAAIDALIEHGKQVVENRAVGVEQLVQKDELRFRQHPGDHRDGNAVTRECVVPGLAIGPVDVTGERAAHRYGEVGDRNGRLHRLGTSRATGR